MKLTAELIRTWSVVNGWHVSPGHTQCPKGNRVRIGDDASIGNYARIGNDARIGGYACDAVDIGDADGYRKCIAQINGVAYIGAGCRWFTLAEALRHWGNHDEDRGDTLALMEAAKAIAVRRGWRFE